MSEKTLKKGQKGNFEFIGNLEYKADDFVKNQKSQKSDWVSSKIAFYVKNGENRVRVNLMGGFNAKSKLYKQDEEGNQLIIDFKDRQNKALTDKVVSWGKYKIGIEKEDKISLDDKGQPIMENGKPKTYRGWKYIEYLADYDLINHLGEILNEKNGMRVQVSGNITYSLYEGKIQTNYDVQRILFLTEEDKKEDKIEIIQELLIDNTCSKDFFKKDEEGNKVLNLIKVDDKTDKIKLNCFTYQYKNKNERVLIPLEVFYVFENNEENRKKLTTLMKKLFVLDNKTVRRMTISGTQFSGKSYENVELPEEEVSDDLKDFLEDYNIEEIKEQIKNTYNTVKYINEIRLKLFPPVFKDENGKMQLNISDNEFTKEDLLPENMIIEETQKTTQKQPQKIEASEVADLSDFFTDENAIPNDISNKNDDFYSIPEPADDDLPF